MQELNTEKCFGCHACYSICPTQCIQMVKNKEGFLYPLIDRAQCISCNRCINVCPLNSSLEAHYPLQALAVRHSDEKIRRESSSGGFFSALARFVLSKNGVVFGAAFDEGYLVRHEMAQTQDQANKFRGSKYIESAIGNTFLQAKECLDKGTLVLFTGTSCQIAGLLNYLGRPYDNLITVDMLCHGVPSPVMWQKYLRSFRSKKPIAVNFRDKVTGWQKFSLSIQFEDSKYQQILFQDPFMDMFLGNFILRESCYHCPFKNHRTNADFTMADFWGIQSTLPEWDDDRGVSLVMTRTNHGEKILRQLSDCIIEPVELDKALEKNIAAFHPPKRSNRRERYLQYIPKKNFRYIYKYCYGSSRTERLKTKVYQIIKR